MLPATSQTYFVSLSEQYYKHCMYYHDKELCPILVRRWLKKPAFRSKGMLLFKKWTDKNGWWMHKKHCCWLKKEHYLWLKHRFKLSPPNENGAELFSMIVRPIVRYVGCNISTLTLYGRVGRKRNAKRNSSIVIWKGRDSQIPMSAAVMRR